MPRRAATHRDEKSSSITRQLFGAFIAVIFAAVLAIFYTSTGSEDGSTTATRMLRNTAIDAEVTPTVDAAACARGTYLWATGSYVAAGRQFGAVNVHHGSCVGLELAMRQSIRFYNAFNSDLRVAGSYRPANPQLTYDDLVAFAALSLQRPIPAAAWYHLQQALGTEPSAPTMEACLLLSGFISHAADSVIALPWTLLSHIETCVVIIQAPFDTSSRLFEATLSLISARLQAPADKLSSTAFANKTLLEALALPVADQPSLEWELLKVVANIPLVIFAARLPLHGGPYFPEIELALTHSRRILLSRVTTDPVPVQLQYPSVEIFAAQLAALCFDNEYVFSVTSEEYEAAGTSLDALVERELSAGLGPASMLVSTLASYKPLHASPKVAETLLLLSEMQHLLAHSGDFPSCMYLVHNQIDAPAAEAAARLEVMAEAAGASESVLETGVAEADAVTVAVKAMYEDNPYPRWSNVFSCIPGTAVCAFSTVTPRYEVQIAAVSGSRGAAALLPALRRGGVEEATGGKQQHIRVLFAGSGTGRQALQMALAEPDATIVGIDLSAASLAYSIRKLRTDPQLTHLNSSGRIYFLQRNLLNLHSLPAAGEDEADAKFDLIEVTGVLHHLQDPEDGLRALVSELRVGGAIKIALYSKTARDFSGVYAARRRIVHSQGTEGKVINASAADIRRGRELILAASRNVTSSSSPSPPLSSSTAEHSAATTSRSDESSAGDSSADGEENERIGRLVYGDFHSISDCRDLVFHVHEHAYTLPEVGRMLRRQSLSFLGFDMDANLRNAALNKYYKKHTKKKDDPWGHAKQATDGETGDDLELWHRVEMEQPGLFAGMYQMWAVKGAASTTSKAQ